jgi:hypothetical protein
MRAATAIEQPQQDGQSDIEVLLDGERPSLPPDAGEIVLHEEGLGQHGLPGDGMRRDARPREVHQDGDQEQEVERGIDLECAANVEALEIDRAANLPFLEEQAEMRKPLSTKKRSTPAHPVFVQSGKYWRWRPSTRRMAMPRSASRLMFLEEVAARRSLAGAAMLSVLIAPPCTAEFRLARQS